MPKSRTYSHQLDCARREIVERALKRHGGNKTHAAWELQIDRQYLIRLVKKFRLNGELTASC